MGYGISFDGKRRFLDLFAEEERGIGNGSGTNHDHFLDLAQVVMLRQVSEFALWETFLFAIEVLETPFVK